LETTLTTLEPNRTFAIIAIQQLVHEWATELDVHDGIHMAGLVSKNCTYHVRGLAREGRDAVAQFYVDRLAEFQAKSIIMTQRHAISNIRVQFDSDSEARFTFLLTYYMSFSEAPVSGYTGPTAVADCSMRAILENGNWRISFFDSVQIFKQAAA
jgi:hypothetical protein